MPRFFVMGLLSIPANHNEEEKGSFLWIMIPDSIIKLTHAHAQGIQADNFGERRTYDKEG